MTHSFRPFSASAPFLLILSLAGCSLFGCSQAAPPDDDDATPGPTTTDPGPTSTPSTPSSGPEPSNTNDPDPPVMGNDDPYFPLLDGAQWTYVHRTDTGDWDERITMTEATWDGRDVFKVEDSPDPDGGVDIQYWEKVGTRTSRVHREGYENGTLVERVDYVPGFVRFDESWMLGTIDLGAYTRTRTDSSGVVTEEQREQRYTVVEVGASVTVEAGTYDDCIVVDRERDDVGDHARFWFARGVGKVKEENFDSGNIEELTAFDPGD